MKMRRHHNNKGFRQIQRGRTRDQVERMAKRLGVPIEANSLSRQKGVAIMKGEPIDPMEREAAGLPAFQNPASSPKEHQ